MDTESIDLSHFFDVLEQECCEVTIESIRKRFAKQSWVPLGYVVTPETYNRDIREPLLKRGWKEVGGALHAPGAAAIPDYLSPSLPIPTLQTLRDKARRRVGTILDKEDVSDSLLAAAIRFTESEPTDQSEIDAYIGADRVKWYHHLRRLGLEYLQRLGLETGVVTETLDKLIEELRYVTQDPG